MLQNLRDQKNSALIVILFAVIIIVFIFMFGLPGADSLSSKTQSDVARVGNHRVTYDLMRTMIISRYDDNIFGTVQYPAVARKTAEAIGVIYLLADEARNAGLRVSAEDLNDYIQNWESGNSDVIRYGFLQKNVFSQRNYEDALRRMQLSKRNYEDYKREELLARRYLTLLSSSITVSDASLWDAYQEANATATLEVIRLTPEDVLRTFKPLTDEEIRAFAQTGKADIRAYYDANIAQYTTPEKVRMQQIVITKRFGTIANPGAKTGTTLQSGERFQIAKKEAADPNADFAQAYADYDESDDKSLNGVSGLIAVDVMAPELQTALEGRKTGDVFTAEMSDRYVIGKVLERTEKIVKTVDEVTNEIARKLLEDRRVAAKTREITTNILAQAATVPLSDLVTQTMYAGILSEAPKARVADIAPAPDGASDEEQNGEEQNGEEQPQAQYVDLPTDLIIIPDAERAKVNTIRDITCNTNYLQGIGVSDDLARDIRTASPDTMLTQAYVIGKDTVLVKIVSKAEASREAFLENLEGFRAGSVRARSEALVGNIDDIVNLQGGYGVWLEEKIREATASGRLKISNEYFMRVSEKIQKAQAERNKEG